MTLKAYDFICKQCGGVQFDVMAESPDYGPKCCGQQTVWMPSLRQHTSPWHQAERSVVWEHPGTGEVRYPGRNDAPMPERYRKQGFERREIAHDTEMKRFEREHRVLNEKAHYDRNGRGHELPLPPLPKFDPGVYDN